MFDVELQVTEGWLSGDTEDLRVSDEDEATE